jgi:GTP-binding protein
MHGAYRQAQFLKGVARLSALPADAGVEVAFAGRSNAGKSSVINALTGRTALARISKTPGRTQQINFFVLEDEEHRLVDLPGYGYANVPLAVKRQWAGDEEHRLVDLPGYGYANVPLAVKRQWAGLVEGYLSARRSLEGVVLLMDARRPFTDADSRLMEWCVHAGLATHVLLNKSDKLSRGAGARVLADARKRLAPLGDEHQAQLFSATRKTGTDELGAAPCSGGKGISRGEISQPGKPGTDPAQGGRAGSHARSGRKDRFR